MLYSDSQLQGGWELDFLSLHCWPIILSLFTVSLESPKRVYWYYTVIIFPGRDIIKIMTLNTNNSLLHWIPFLRPSPAVCEVRRFNTHSTLLSQNLNSYNWPRDFTMQAVLYWKVFWFQYQSYYPFSSSFPVQTHVLSCKDQLTSGQSMPPTSPTTVKGVNLWQWRH